jgi:hypothetical protein
MGELAERTVLAEAEEARHWLPHMRRMRLVASNRYERGLPTSVRWRQPAAIANSGRLSRAVGEQGEQVKGR